jgi:4-diphosphocytidyl-2-C-methyl-D-erythritol kinase
MILFPPAKINLGLQIHSKRSDGFHEIETCMLPIPFYDILELKLSAAFSFKQTGIKIQGAVGENLCEKAFYLMKSRYEIGNVHIHLRKQIPIGAGLGGGSSDAAHVLLALNELFALKLDIEILCLLAAELGSDCPFFIRNEPQLAKGRGELLTPISLNLNGLYCVLFNPKIHVSTKEAYSGVSPRMPDKTLRELLSQPIEVWPALLQNDFEESVFKAHPKIAQLKSELEKTSSCYVSMSGSGASVFALFKEAYEVPSSLTSAVLAKFYL